MARSATRSIGDLVSRTISSIVNGVSQQPPTLRLPSQGEDQVNMISTVTDGVERRPGSDFQFTLHSSALHAKGHKFHMRSRNGIQQHVVLLEDGDCRVWNTTTGIEAVVTVSAGAATYLGLSASGLARDDFAILSVADYSFIVNKEVTVAKSATISPAARPNEFMVYAFETTVSSGTKMTTTIGSNEVEIDNFNVVGSGTAYPGELVRTLLGEGVGDPYPTAPYTNWTFSIPSESKNVFYGLQTGSTGSPETVYPLTWEYSDETYSFIYKQAQKFSDLPPRGIVDFVVEITGEDGNEDNNYYVKFDDSTGAWVETVQHGIANSLDATTMPHVLIQDSIGLGAGGADEFTLDVQAWDARSAGNATTAPDPSFVGYELSDVIFHKNRLGFTAEESIVLSETGEFFNFYPTTVATLIDSDPIYAANTNNRISIIDYALPFFGKLFLFSGHAGIQNVLDQAKGGGSGVGLTSVSAEVVEASAFAASPKCRPVSTGQAAYFVVDKGEASAMMEYTVKDNVADAQDISSHVPTYLPANIFSISASSKENMIVLVSTDTPYELFTYGFLFDDGQRLQSAWSKWTFDDDNTILGAEWVGEKLYIVFNRTDGTHLEIMDFGKLVQGGLAHNCHLDCKEEVQGVYSADTLLSTFTMGHAVDPAAYDDYVGIATGASHGDDLGRVLELTFVTATETFTTPGDFDADTVTIGKRFDHTYEFSTPIIEESSPDGKGVVPVTQGRLQINRWKLLTKNSGGFGAKVLSSEIPVGDTLITEDAYIYEYPDKYTNQGVVDVMHPPEDSEFLFDVGMENKYARIIVFGNSHLPCIIVGAGWEGIYSRRSTRI